MDLLCVALPVNDIQRPQSHDLYLMEQEHPVVSNSLMWTVPAPLPDPGVMPTFPKGPYYPLLDTMARQVDPNLFVPCSRATMIPPVCPTSSPHVQLGLHAFPQAPIQQPNAQYRQQAATLTMLSDSQPDNLADAGTTSWVADTSHDLRSNNDPWSCIHRVRA